MIVDYEFIGDYTHCDKYNGPSWTSIGGSQYMMSFIEIIVKTLTSIHSLLVAKFFGLSRRQALVAFLSTSLLFTVQVAGENIITDRPDQTESSVSITPGNVQFEIGWTHTFVDADGAESRTNEFPQTLIRIGAINRLEIRLGLAGIV